MSLLDVLVEGGGSCQISSGWGTLCAPGAHLGLVALKTKSVCVLRGYTSVWDKRSGKTGRCVRSALISSFK